MNRSIVISAVALAACLSTLAANAQPRAQAPTGQAAQPAQVAAPGPGKRHVSPKFLYERARSHERAGRWQDALNDYHQARVLLHDKVTWDAAANQGNAAYQLGLYAEAATMLRRALIELPEGEPNRAMYRRKVMDRLAQAMDHVVALAITSDPPGAVVWVNGQRAGRAPLPRDVLAMPAALVIEAKLDGYQDARRLPRARAGTRLRIHMVLSPGQGSLSARAAAPPAGSPALPAHGQGNLGTSRAGGTGVDKDRLGTEPADGSWSTGVGVTALVIGGASVAAGAALLISAGAHSRREAELAAEADASYPWITMNPCGTGPVSVAACSPLNRAARTANSHRHGGIAALAAGGAVAAAGLITLLLATTGRGDDIYAVEVRPHLSPGLAGIDIVGRF